VDPNKDLIPVSIKGIYPAPQGHGVCVFIGNEEKTIVIFMDANVGNAISMFLKNEPKPRPLTHDLIGNILQGLKTEVVRVIINNLQQDTYFARLILQENSEVAKKIVEIDARPSDCLAIAAGANAPIFIASHVFDQVADSSDILSDILKKKQGE